MCERTTLISVPHDKHKICRAEVCFGQMSEDDLGFSLRCKPRRAEKSRGFTLGDRVACAVEDADATGEFTVWAAGTVSNVDYDVENDATELGLNWNWTGGAGVMPYRVLLDLCDGGSAPAPAQQQQSHSSLSRPRPRSRHVFVHRDVHWLLRGLELQPAGPRQSADGSRAGPSIHTLICSTGRLN